MEKTKFINIAVDGPSGAGKSTLSKEAAKELGFIYVDTGAMYRALGLMAFENKIDPKNEDAVKGILKKAEISFQNIDGKSTVFLNGENVESKIRQNEISKYASDISALPVVRAFLLDMQKQLAAKNNVIMDGRDIGTVVLPAADIKLFLTATPEDRAKRRCDELLERGQSLDYDIILKEIKERDFNDSNRPVAPLKQADDAVLIDTTGNTYEKSRALVINTIKEKLNELL